MLPDRFFEPFDKGEARAARPVDRTEYEQAKHTYHRMMGWNEETGVPTRETLAELGVEWAADLHPAE
jgi:aldehyde:ferredoxin oxidoreductase